MPVYLFLLNGKQGQQQENESSPIHDRVQQWQKRQVIFLNAFFKRKEKSEHNKSVDTQCQRPGYRFIIPDHYFLFVVAAKVAQNILTGMFYKK
jgi:hypothetical protein